MLLKVQYSLMFSLWFDDPLFHSLGVWLCPAATALTPSHPTSKCQQNQTLILKHMYIHTCISVWTCDLMYCWLPLLISVSSGLHRPQLFGPWGVYSRRVSLSAGLGRSQLWDRQGHVPGPVFRSRHLQCRDQHLYLWPELDWAGLLFRCVSCVMSCVNDLSVYRFSFHLISFSSRIFKDNKLYFNGICKSSVTPSLIKLIKGFTESLTEDNEVQDQHKMKTKKQLQSRR